jgi:hypothetical protein
VAPIAVCVGPAVGLGLAGDDDLPGEDRDATGLGDDERAVGELARDRAEGRPERPDAGPVVDSDGDTITWLAPADGGPPAAW